MRATDQLEHTDPRAYVPGQVCLDWRDGSHYQHGKPRKCRSCFGPTNLLDDDGRPCHKTCAEAELEADRRRMARAYEAER